MKFGICLYTKPADMCQILVQTCFYLSVYEKKDKCNFVSCNLSQKIKRKKINAISFPVTKYLEDKESKKNNKIGLHLSLKLFELQLSDNGKHLIFGSLPPPLEFLEGFAPF